ncbi:LysR family transcriptional regulator [Reyranella sp.]|jgi:DNA-binding transcriptional LysR family regulator|uniref:LysR family transcriptional regulator n=1 Tax=Reyranella sp. TaxID=1929291 RepID=UPI002F928D2B
MNRLDDIEAFLAIVERGSLTAAARHLRRSLQSISRSLGALERGVAVELVRRTTRSSQPTEAGLAFYRRVRPAFEEIAEARREAASRQAEPSGLLRVGGPVMFAASHMVPVICDLARSHPRLEIELKTSDREVDLVAERLDLAVRIRAMRDSSLKARRLAELRAVVFGAPAYFARHGRPAHPDELARHECIIRLTEAQEEAWPFRIDGRRRMVKVKGRFRADSVAATNAAAAQGLGVAFGPLWQVRELVDRGAVEIVLDDFEAARVPIHAVWRPTRTPLAKARLFADLLAARLRRHEL